MLVTRDSVAPASGNTSALIKKAIVDAAEQNQPYDILYRSIRKHYEKRSSLDTIGLSVAIPLSGLYYNSATVWLQGFYCSDNCTNFFDNCVCSMLQLYKSGLSQSSSVSGWRQVDYCSRHGAQMRMMSKQRRAESGLYFVRVLASRPASVSKYLLPKCCSRRMSACCTSCSACSVISCITLDGDCSCKCPGEN